MSYGKFRFDSKNFLLGIGSIIVAMILPVISEPLINLITGIRDKMPWSNSK